MLINKTCLAWAICCWTIVAAAQSNQPDYDKIYSENPPAFTILGVEPTTIERPGTPQKFAASVQNLFQNGKPQPGFALEFTPGLWRTDSLILNSKAYIENTSLTKYFWQHLSFSVATSSTDSTIYGNLAPGTGYSIGGKLLVLSGKPSEKTQNKIMQLDLLLDEAAGYNAYLSSIVKSKFATRYNIINAGENLVNKTQNQLEKDAINTVVNELLAIISNDSIATLGTSSSARHKKLITEEYLINIIKNYEDGSTIKSVYEKLRSELFDGFLEKVTVQNLVEANRVIAADLQKELKSEQNKQDKQVLEDRLRSAKLIIAAGDTLLTKMENDRWTEADLESFINAKKQKIAEMDITVEREGPMLEIAGAGMSALPDNKWDNHIAAAKIGFWVNYTHRINLSKAGLEDNNKYFDFGGVARYIINKQSSSVKIDSSNYFDFGAKAGFQINKAKIAGEYIHRVITNKPESLKEGYTWRLTLNFEYQFTDAIGIKVSFGKGFDGNTLYYDNNDQQFLGVAGLNVSLPGIK